MSEQIEDYVETHSPDHLKLHQNRVGSRISVEDEENSVNASPVS